MKFSDILRQRPLTGAVIFQGALIPLALVLALVFGLSPWNELRISFNALLIACLATLPPLALAWWLSRWSYRWVSDLAERVQDILAILFRGAGQGAVIIVSLLAGFGEELLFRGVLQAGLEAWLGATAGLLLASLVFGLVHAITPAYFILATLMGLYLGLLYQLTGNLLIACLVHALYDWAAITWYLRRRQ